MIDATKRIDGGWKMDWIPAVVTGSLALLASLTVAIYNAKAVNATGRELARLERQVELEKEIDIDLRAKREARYLELWRIGASVSKMPRNRDLTWSDLVDMHNHLRDWYFDGGGMYLSGQARAGYGELQQCLGRHLESGDHRSVLGDDVYDDVQQRFSALRTELTKDLQSRVREREFHSAH